MTDVQSYAELLALRQRELSDPKWSPVHLGFGTIDAEIRGVSMSQVLGIAARTAVGKTWLVETIEHNFAARTDAGQLSLSLEMPGGEWFERAVAIHLNVAPEQVERWARAGELSDRAASFLDRMQRTLVCERMVPLSGVSAVIAEARERLDVPLRLVHIDYLGLLRAPGSSAYERISTVGRELKEIAKREDVAIIVAMQASRAAGNGGDPLSLEMLRDSGVLEESLDFLLGCWRPGLKMSEETRQSLVDEEIAEADDVMTVEVLKNRKGARGRRVDLRFMPLSRRLYEPTDPFVGAL